MEYAHFIQPQNRLITTMDTYALVGYPLGHSFSKQFFSDKFILEHIDAEYLNLEIDNINRINKLIAHYHIKGFNVTIPYKQQIIPLLNSVSNEAKDIGAVNVVKVIYTNGMPQLKGYNSDIFGFSKSISPLLKPHHKQALILGTGGASKAIKLGLEQMGISCQYVSRNSNNGVITYQELTKEIIKQYTVIINCTPLGTYPNIEEAPDIPYEYLTANHLLYDLVYNPEQTTFLKNGSKQGAQVKNGLEMLELQALKAWEIWQND